jgi:YbbR domain-containing protein
MSYYVKTSSLLPKISAQIGTECTITSIKPDTLFFAFDRIISKKVPVIPDLGINTERQYFVKGKISVTPDSVKITGPKHLLDTMNCVRTLYRKFSGLNRTIKRTVGIYTSKQYTVSDRSAAITIQVEQFTEAEAKVRVKVLNAPQALDVKIFPDAVKVTGLVAISDYRRFQDLPFDVVLDVAKADLVKEKRLPLEIRNVPAFINSLRLTPPDVDFLIEKKPK